MNYAMPSVDAVLINRRDAVGHLAMFLLMMRRRTSRQGGMIATSRCR